MLTSGRLRDIYQYFQGTKYNVMKSYMRKNNPSKIHNRPMDFSTILKVHWYGFSFLLAKNHLSYHLSTFWYNIKEEYIPFPATYMCEVFFININQRTYQSELNTEIWQSSCLPLNYTLKIYGRGKTIFSHQSFLFYM